MDFGLVEGQEHGDLDGGDEGPLAADEELREQDLPDLDAGRRGRARGGGDAADGRRVRRGRAGGAAVGGGAVGARRGRRSPSRRPRRLACAGRGALVAGRAEGGEAELVRVDLEGACQAMPAEGLDVARVRALQVEGSTVAATSARAPPSRSSRSTEARASKLAPGAAVVTADAALVQLLAESDAQDEAPEARKPAVVAQRGGHVAYAARHGGVACRTADGGWKASRWDGVVTALAFVDDAGTLVAAAYSEADDTTALVRLDANGHASVVARVGASRSDPESDGRVLAMAHDTAREVVWVAGGFGIAAFAVR